MEAAGEASGPFGVDLTRFVPRSPQSAASQAAGLGLQLTAEVATLGSLEACDSTGCLVPGLSATIRLVTGHSANGHLDQSPGQS
jgi:hypothetical protein